VDPDLLESMRQGILTEYGGKVEVLKKGRLPRAAFYPPRKRYRADRLLDHLDLLARKAGPQTRILGLCSVDISTTKGRHPDWGIFGLGQMGGRACVVSTHRLRRGARDRDHLRQRVLSTAIHEVGHTLGLPHCPTPRCVMQDAEGGIRNTDESTGRLCPRCQIRISLAISNP
jgi:archaemetzincin